MPVVNGCKKNACLRLIDSNGIDKIVSDLIQKGHLCILQI